MLVGTWYPKANIMPPSFRQQYIQIVFRIEIHFSSLIGI